MITLYRLIQRIVRNQQGSTHTLAILLNILMSMLRVCLGYAKGMPRVCQGYAWSMARVCLGANILFPYWEQNFPILGTKHSHLGNKTGLRLAVSLLLLLTLGSGSVWGQIDEGLYYIKSNAGQTYYLCPAIGCYYENNVDHPHLTTFQTSGDQNSVWEVKLAETVSSVSYYYLIHHKTGKYLKSNEGFSIDVGENRKAVHLEDKPSSLDEYYEFCIKNNSGIYQIYPKKYDSAPDNVKNMSFNCRGGNQAYYFPQNGLAMGIVGLYTYSGQTGSQWKFTTVDAASTPCATPIIKYDGDNINISYPYRDETGITIYYTTDGSDPSTTSSSNSSTSFNIPASGVVKVRAFAAKTGLVNSDEAVLWGSGRPFLVQSTENVNYYLAPSGNASNVNTTSVASEKMQWTLQDAGVSTGGVQYYYLVNSNGKKIQYASTLGMNEASAEDNEFCIVENGYNTGVYFLIPISSPGKWVYKTKGNVDLSNVAAADMKDPTKDSTFPFSQWKLKECNSGSDQKSLFSAPPLTVSNDNETHYYFIQNKGKEGYYIIPPSDPDGYVAISNTSGDYNDVPWVIKAATSDNWLTYYNIINAATGKYMYFNGGNNLTAEYANAFSMKDISESTAATEEKYQFILVWTTTANTCYIVPKGYANNFYKSQYYSIWYDDQKTTVLKTYWSRTSSANNVKWTFNETDINNLYLDPVFSQDENGYISITHPTVACDIYYTTNGEDPIIPANAETAPTAPTIKYTGTFLPSIGVEQIKAIAVFKNNYGVYSNVESYPLPACPTPSILFDNAENTITITSATEGATIYYTTDGSTDPTVNESIPHGTSPITISDITAGMTVKAITIISGYKVSDVVTATIQKVVTPTIQENGSNAISITTTTSDATIYYTIDGSTPTTSSSEYTEPLTDNVSNVTIKAIAVKENMITSAVGSGSVKLQCGTPTITRVGMTFTLSCSKPTDANLYYTLGGGSEVKYTGTPVSFTADQLPVTVTAVARHNDYTESETASMLLKTGSGTSDDPYLIYGASDFANFVTNVNNGTTASKYYKLGSDVSASGVAEITTNFTGSFDGGGYTISGLSHPLFNIVDGGVVKNVMLKNVHINQSGNVGAITGEAKGYTRIYNCGILPNDNMFSNRVRHSSVASTDAYCGGLVGWLKDDSRVINCFSFANVNGGTVVAGIVGYNDFASTAKETDGKYTELKTAIVNCMFYGNITGGTTRYPVYGGKKILNNTATGINNYDFYRAEANLGLADNSHYNCSWPAQEEYLTKYEYYRYLLNSNRELCGWWVGAPSAPSGMLIADVQAVEKDASMMAKWVLDPSIAPYPILKPAGKYYSVINQDPDNRINPDSKAWESRPTSENTIMTKAAPDTEGQKLGSINVTINKGGSLSGSDSKNIPITAMDIENNDFCYGKIQLPYYNSIFGDPNSSDWTTRYGGNYGDKVVVGWEITSVTGGTEGELVKNWETGYNFADRDCTNKDKERIFAQGGYYYVPNGVSAITITAKWADAIYLDNSADHSYDRVYMSYNTNPNKNIGYHFAPAGSRPSSLGNGKTVQTASVSNQIPDGSVYEKAIVLVGNHQYRTDGNDVGTADKGCTIISADFNFDDEPDYSLIWQLGTKTNRQNICPIRFDFLPVIEMGMAMKEDASTQYYSLGCYLPLGHFEVTETSLIHFGQFEFGNATRTKDAPLILNGGIFNQYCKGTKAKNTAEDHIDYVILGGNVYMPSFSPGAHVNAGAKFPTRHCAVNVLGGRINNLYLTGNFNNAVTPNKDNPHCYIDGGNFKQIAAAAKEGINGDVYFRINHSVINEFYGGSTLADKLVSGSIDVVVDNSKVTKYCGGPKFGNMTLDAVNPENNKTVTTNATGTTFGVYYGGGNGGTSYVQYASTDKTVEDATGSYDWDSSSWGNLTSYTPNTYRSGGKNYIADYEMEIVNSSAGTDAKKGIFRTYLYAAQFSATNTGPITNNLTNCKVLTSFYGGGNLGGVIGDVTSTLTDTEVLGSAFGAGYSASVPEVTIYNKDKTAPTLNVYTGIITPTPDPDPNSTSTTYTWCYKNKTTNVVIPSGVVIPNNVGTGNPTFEYEGKRYFYTEESLENLGTVTGKVTLKIEGTTTVKHSAYGGGEESGVDGNTEVKVTGGTIGTTGKGGAEYGNVYGGGKGKEKDVAAGLVKGNTTVSISQASAEEPTTIYHNVYGGGAYGSVGTFTYDGTTGMPTALATANTGACTINITGGTLGSNGDQNGMVFGSSRGDVATPEGTPAVDPNDRMAWVYSTQVNIGIDGTTTGPAIKGSVYGSGENGHTLQNTVLNINSGTIGIPTGEPIGDYSGAAYPYRGNVYGGGCGTDTYWIDADEDGEVDEGEEHYNPLAGIVRGTTTVNIKGGQVVHHVYGAGAMGSVGNDADATSGKTTINISGGRIGYDGNRNGNVFGAARGEYGISTAASGLANVRETAVNISYTTTPTEDDEEKTTQLIAGSVFGGGEAGTVKESVAVRMTGGLILKDIYGGGALADTQTTNWDTSANSGAGDWAEGKTSTSATTTVRLTGGRVGEEVFGGGLGEAGKPAYVWGDVLVDLNGTTIEDNGTEPISTSSKGCVVNQLFGCNNVNGSPKGDVLVHVHATQNGDASKTNIASKFAKDNEDLEQGESSNEDYIAKLKRILADKIVIADKLSITVTDYQDVVEDDGATATEVMTALTGITGAIGAKTSAADMKIINGTRYDVYAVYGGGNLAAYEPVGGKSTTNYTNVIIDGCELTSIETVYGGGNAASTPATETTVNGTYEIYELFGGGNGKDKLPSGADNPGANVGFYDYSAVESTYDTKEKRQQDAFVNKYVYGTGKATVNVFGGTIHRVFGGSNTKGNVRQTALTLLDEGVACPFCVEEAYGGGKSAEMDAEAQLLMACIPGLEAVYGGAEAADVHGNVTLNITNGTFDRVFGGNNLSGTIGGAITINVEEIGCKPVKIGELYGGGNEAGYSVYGYDAQGKPKESGTKLYNDPQVNVMSFTSIGNIYGGGYGDGATMVGNPTVNVNVAYGKYYDDDMSIVGENEKTPNNYPIPSHAKGKMGAIYNVFGGGNAAKVIGNATVNIATLEEVYVVKQVTVGETVSGLYTRSGEGTTDSPFVYTATATTDVAVDGTTYYEKKDVLGADIRDNVYGGGNNAEVTGDATVNVGKRVE